MPSKKKGKGVVKTPPETATVEPVKNDDAPTEVVPTQDPVTHDVAEHQTTRGSIPEQAKGTDTPKSGRSWYGAWPSKSKQSVVLEQTPQKETEIEPVTEATRESAKPRDAPTKRKPLLSPGGSVRSLPLVATITKLNISSETSKAGDTKLEETTVTGADKTTDTLVNPRENEHIPSKESGGEPAKADTGIGTPTSWLSWSRGDMPFLPSISIGSALATGDGTNKSATTTAVNTEPAAQHNTAISKPSEDPVSGNSDPMTQSTWLPKWPFTGTAEPAKITDPTSDPPEQSITTTTDTEPTSKSEVDIKRSSWAFWSNSTQNHDASGQIAVSSSPSQTTEASPNGTRLINPDESKKRPLSQGDEPAKKKQASSTTEVGKKIEEKVVKEKPNILLPTFESTYSVYSPDPSLWERFGSWIYSSAPKKTTLLKEPRKIKHALAIGVHGYFPAAIVQTLLGKPTGTSIKFAEHAAKAIEDFTGTYGYAPQSLDKIALEGEGRIDERLDLLWKLLLNWIDLIRKADFILVACHSQGVPVAISLVSKLIGFGCVSEARIGICAMAGISRGPFAEYKSRWIGGSAAELFEFSDPKSAVSRAYRDALETVLRFGVKVVYIGSLDDQLVPLHSSTFTHVNHPNIYRAVFVDGKVHVADFISHLVGFALKLRNLNTSDHGLIRELSNPLAGSLVGEGHSRIYDDPAVYRLAMDFALRTTDVSAKFESDDTPILTVFNPYILPFAMRGVLEEDVVRNELSGEVIDLLKQFDKWKPLTKVLKDVKYRLEGVKSKL